METKIDHAKLKAAHEKKAYKYNLVKNNNGLSRVIRMKAAQKEIAEIAEAYKHALYL